MPRAFVIASVFATVLAVAVPADAQVNVSGTWQPKNWTLRISLRQEGSDVTGSGGANDFWFRALNRRVEIVLAR